ncbi:RHS repeat-associated core domain-containing protein, partial [Pantanalinema rosaneae CENA516]|uniref:RHS repeat-associated core domain-containing protein n=1 Tax=Pantanalinema rosaneae TaxID=1620701 RepID=UPI003D6EA2FE
QQRYYRPGLGRFNRVDPWEGDTLRPITLNKYLYANGNPLLYVDPDGRCGMQLGDDFCELGAAVANGWSPEQYHDHLKVRSQAERDASEAAFGLGRGVAKVGAEGVWDTLKLGLSLAKSLGGNTEAGDEVMSVLRGAAGVVAAPGRSYAQASASFGEGLDEQRRLMASGDIGGAWETRGRLASGFVYALTPLASRTSLLSSGAATNRVVQQARPLTVVEDGGSARFGETASTRIGRDVHAGEAAWRRESGMFDVVNGPIADMAGVPILVPKRVDLRTGQPQPGTPLQTANPDAASYQRSLIVDDKPLGRPPAKDRQEIIRFIEAYRQREGRLPETIGIQRYDPRTGQPVRTDLCAPEDFLPPNN